MTWPRVALGEVLQLAVHPVEVSPEQTYPTFGVYGFGRGLFDKAPVTGAEISAEKLYRASAGQFVYSRLKAFEGAFGVVPAAFDGRYVTNEFPTFTCVPNRLDPNYLGLYFRRSEAWSEAARLSTGVGARRERLHPEQFLSLAVPCPPLSEQERIVARVDAIAARVAEARRLREEAVEDTQRLCRAVLRDTSHGPSTPTQMRELVRQREQDVTVQRDKDYHFAGVYCFGRGVFKGQRKKGLEFSYDRLTTLRAGDFVYPKLMAWEGALAVVPPECHGLVVSTEFPVFEIDTDRVLPEVLDVYFRDPEVWPHLSSQSTGTNVRRQRLNPSDFLNYQLPLPPRRAQERLKQVATTLVGLRSLQAETAAELDALLPAVLARAFAGGL